MSLGQNMKKSSNPLQTHRKDLKISSSASIVKMQIAEKAEYFK